MKPYLLLLVALSDFTYGLGYGIALGISIGAFIALAIAGREKR
jgi:hypothetical protein